MGGYRVFELTLQVRSGAAISERGVGESGTHAGHVSVGWHWQGIDFRTPEGRFVNPGAPII